MPEYRGCTVCDGFVNDDDLLAERGRDCFSEQAMFGEHEEGITQTAHFRLVQSFPLNYQSSVASFGRQANTRR